MDDVSIAFGSIRILSHSLVISISTRPGAVSVLDTAWGALEIMRKCTSNRNNVDSLLQCDLFLHNVKTA